MLLIKVTIIYVCMAWVNVARSTMKLVHDLPNGMLEDDKGKEPMFSRWIHLRVGLESTWKLVKQEPEKLKKDKPVQQIKRERVSKYQLIVKAVVWLLLSEKGSVLCSFSLKLLKAANFVDSGDMTK